LVDKEALHYLLNEHEGELLLHDSKDLWLKVSYTRGAILMFSKLEIFFLQRDKIPVDNGKIKVTPEELQKFFEAYQFIGFIPLLELILASDDISPDTLKETKENVTNGLYSFIRLKDSKTEMIIVSVGSEKPGVFYCPDSSLQEELIPLIEFKKDTVKIHKDNLKKVPQL
jgi:hypothetical protein